MKVVVIMNDFDDRLYLVKKKEKTSRSKETHWLAINIVKDA